MISKCYDCPRTKGIISLGKSPCCEADDFYMDVNTHIAECPICKERYGVPMVVEGLCYKDISNKKYSITITETPSKAAIPGLSKLLGMNASKVYHLFTSNSPVIFDGISMLSAYKIRNYLRSIDTSMQITPSLDEYHLFEDCHKTNL